MTRSATSFRNEIPVPFQSLMDTLHAPAAVGILLQPEFSPANLGMIYRQGKKTRYFPDKYTNKQNKQKKQKPYFLLTFVYSSGKGR